MNTISENPLKNTLRRNKLGDILLQANLIDQNTLNTALQIQKKSKKRIGQILIDMGVSDDEKIAKALAGQLNIPFLRLSDIDIPKEVIDIVPQELAENYLLLPIKMIKKQLVVVMVNPLEFYALDDLRFITRMDIFVTIAPQSDILSAIHKYYPRRNLEKDMGPDMGLLENIEFIGHTKEKDHNVQDLLNLTELPPVVRFTSSILADAIRMKASDIHIEPQKDNVVIRYRIDGIMREIMKIDKQIHLSLVSRIKIISNMDISIRRKPQDGRAQVKIGENRFDLRTSTIPTSYGEKVTIRILNPNAGGLGIEKIGFSDRDLRFFREAIERPQGIILVTGPTGSGKSSTLYTALNHINSPQVNIVTVEDPVEFDIPGINQVQINPKAGISFADGLRSILRQDPDVVMVGEIRDGETARIAFQAAQTGHLVLSTLHTNDAPSAVTRLLDMGVDSFVIADSLVAVLGQRLVRGICNKCKLPDPLTPQIFEQLETLVKPDRSKKFWKGTGCEACQYSGYVGRLGIFELLMITPTIKEILTKNVSSPLIKKAAEMDGYSTLSMDGINKALLGLTTIEEIFRVAPPAHDDAAQVSENVSVKSKISDVNEDASGMLDQPASVGSIRPEKILIVDDNPVDINFLKNILEYHNFITVTASSGDEALKIAFQEKPALIITDYLMPEMDGKVLVTKLKSQLATRFIPIILLTAKDEVDIEVEFFSLGVNDYLTKPFNSKRLIARVCRLLSRPSDAPEYGE